MVTQQLQFAFHPWVASGVPPPMWVPVLLICVGGEYSGRCSLRAISFQQFLPVLEGSKDRPPLHCCELLHVADSSERSTVCHPAVGGSVALLEGYLGKAVDCTLVGDLHPLRRAVGCSLDGYLQALYPSTPWYLQAKYLNCWRYYYHCHCKCFYIPIFLERMARNFLAQCQFIDITIQTSGRIRDLMAYQALIVKAAYEGTPWLSYDTHFRSVAATMQ